jgi:2-iminobutanoate/2-iminopropanoate deaminase
MREGVTPQGGPKPVAPYTPAIRASGTFIFVSGQIPARPDGSLVEGTIADKLGQCLRNIDAILKAAGATLDDLVRTSVYLKDMDDFAEMNKAYGAFFGDTPPARTTVEVARLPRDVAVEVDGIAVLP